MRPVRGRRLLAVALVLLSAGTALAIQVWPQAQFPSSNPFVLQGSAGRIVFSLRNTNSTTSNISFGSNAGSDCTMMSSPVPLLNPGAPSPWSIAPGEQMQFVVNTAGLNAARNFSCMWSIQENTTFGQSVSVTFKSSTTAVVDVQPTSINFGQQPLGQSEDQQIVATSWGGSQDVMFELQSQDSVFTLEGCGSATVCTIPLPGSGGVGSATVRCTSDGNGSANGVVNVKSTDGLTTYASVTLLCEASGMSMGSDLYWDPDMLALVGMGSSSITASGSAGSITNLSLFGGNGTITVSQCSTGGCNYMPGLVLPQTYTILCNPSSVTETATLTAMGPGSAVAMATITCSPTPGGPPILDVSPNQVSFPGTAVGQMATDTVTITNTGGGTLMNISVALNGVDATHFGYDFACTQGCPLGAGSSMTFDVSFAPQSHGGKTANITVSANGSGSGSGSGSQSDTVTLDGSGTGGILVVEDPQNLLIDFGVLPLDSTGSATVTVRNDGNVAIMAMLTDVESPYAVTGSSTQDVNAFGGTALFETTCGSSVAGTYNDTWTVVAPTAYAGSPQTINVLCAVANTNVDVEPNMFDFGEVRIGTAVDPKTLTITNPGPGNVQLTKMQLREPRTGLSLTPATTSRTLAPTDVATATLALATGSDTDLTGETIDITVDGEDLALPVRGKVVTPHSRVAPEELDLGTACVGTEVVGQVRLINDGTATLVADRPEMEDNDAFQANATGVLWPATLAPGNEIVVDVTPTNSASGPITGMLAWNDDVPSQYRVPVTLEYVTSGTALSPRGLDFGQVVVDQPSHTQRLNLENCDEAERTVTVKSIRGIKGPIGAWVLDPRIGFRKTLASHERLAVLVTFTPPARGHYEAEVVIETEGGQETIMLIGDATGRDFGVTSFYSCSCSAPGTGFLGGWPIVLALVIVSGRRRGSSSAR